MRQVHFILASLAIILTAAGLYWGNVSVDVISDFADRNDSWTEELTALSDLQRATTFVAVAANDIADASQVADRRALRDRALVELDQMISRIDSGLRELMPNAGSEIDNAVELLRWQRNKLAADSDKVFEALAAGDVNAADAAVSVLNRSLLEFPAILSEFNRLIRAGRVAEFQAQRSFADLIDRYRYIVSAVILTLLLGIAVVGLHFERRARLVEESERRTLIKLAEREQQLRLALEQARQATEQLARQERLAMLGDVAATVSHELRNPLAAIQASLDVIQLGLSEQDVNTQHALERCDRNVRRCADIISTLRDFVRERPLMLEETSIDEWMEALLAEEGERRGRRIEWLPGAVGSAWIDRAQLRMALGNLLDNAFHAVDPLNASEKGGAGSGVSVATSAAGSHVRIAVMDTGTGIAADVLPRIFDPLFTTKSFGVGLGLPTVRKIVGVHGGNVEAASDGRTGSCVTLSLPRMPPRQDTATRPAGGSPRLARAV